MLTTVQYVIILIVLKFLIRVLVSDNKISPLYIPSLSVTSKETEKHGIFYNQKQTK